MAFTRPARATRTTPLRTGTLGPHRGFRALGRRRCRDAAGEIGRAPTGRSPGVVPRMRRKAVDPEVFSLDRGPWLISAETVGSGGKIGCP